MLWRTHSSRCLEIAFRFVRLRIMLTLGVHAVNVHLAFPANGVDALKFYKKAPNSKHA